jgi:hypothetical protein
VGITEKQLLRSGTVLAEFSSVRQGPPDISELPVRVDRETAAKLLTKYFFRTHRRTLERWPLAWRLLNGRAHCETAELFAIAEAQLAEAVPVRGGRANTQEAV